VVETQKLLRFGVFELNLATEELRQSGTLIKLAPQPFRLLVLLAGHAGVVVTREEIQRQLWGKETYVDFEQGVNKCIKQIRTVLNDNADKPLYIETLPRHGYRFLAPVVSKNIAAPAPKITKSTSGIESGIAANVLDRVTKSGSVHITGTPAPIAAAPKTESLPAAAEIVAPEVKPATRRSYLVWLGLVFLLLVTCLLFLQARRTPRLLSQNDSIVLADFDNNTGDPGLDETLRTGLEVLLEQSPSLNVLPTDRVAEALSAMGKAKDTRLTAQIAREVCQRTASAATIEGSIADSAGQYALDFKVVSCRSGALLAEERVQAADREQVIRSLGQAVKELRIKLGEPVAFREHSDHLRLAVMETALRDHSRYSRQ
jgi:DNA-binding winged helix-turn-helix (wHTH) protein